LITAATASGGTRNKVSILYSVNPLSTANLQAQRVLVIRCLLEASVELHVAATLRIGDWERSAGGRKVALAIGVKVIVLLEAGAVPVVEGVYAHGEGKRGKGEGKEREDVHGGCSIGGNCVFVYTKSVVMMGLI
jgi:hypothetical protein